MKATLVIATIAARTGLGLFSALVMAAPAIAQPADPRNSRGTEVITTLSGGAGSQSWMHCVAMCRRSVTPF
jgi:hypothetical protein